MLKLFTCTKEIVKYYIDKETQEPQSPFKTWKGWIGAIERGTFFTVYYYVKFPQKSYDLHYYLRKIK